ncbi:hypothetical protein ACF0H5_021643 [Mactra antiquata]
MEKMSRYNIIQSTCLSHVGDNVTAFCNKHYKTLCLKCVLEDHSTCVAEKKVEDIKISIEESKKMIPNMVSSCDYIANVVNQLSENTKDCMDNIDRSEGTIITKIEQIKNDLITKIEHLYNESLDMVKSVIEEQKCIILHDSVAVESLVGSIKDSKAVLDRLVNGDNVPITEVKSMIRQVHDIESKMNGTDLCMENVMFSFNVSHEVDYLKKRLLSLGELCFNRPKDNRDKISTMSSEKNNPIDVNDTYSQSVDEFIQSKPSDPPPACLGTDGYVAIDHNDSDILPPPLPSSHPPSSNLHVSNSEQEITPTNDLRPQNSVRRMESKQNRIHDKTDENSERPKLVMPPLPKKKLSKMRKQKIISSDNDGDDTDGDTSSSVYHTIICEPLTHEPGMDKVVAIDTTKYAQISSHTSTTNVTIDIDNSPPSGISPLKVHQATFEDWKSATSKQATTLPKSRLPFACSTLKPPKSHSFMWSDSGVTRSSSTRSFTKDSGMNTSWSDTGLTSKRGPRLAHEAKSSHEGSHMMKFIPARHVHPNVFNDFDENLKSLSHSDLPNLNLKLPKELARTSSEKSIDMERYVDDTDGMDFQKGGYSQKTDASVKRSSSDATTGTDNSSNQSCDAHLQNMRLCECSSKEDTHAPISQCVSEGSSVNEEPAVSRAKPCVVKEKRSDQCRLFKLPDINELPGQSGNHHSTITGIAITNSGHLLVCDFENNSVQHYNPSGTLVSDCSVPEPISCCYIKDGLVAVASKKKKTLTIFELSETTMSFKQEIKIGLVMEVFGVVYAGGFFAIGCLDQVLLYTEHLKPYCEVKPLVSTQKKRSKSYFSDVRYVAMEIREQTRICTSEHNVNRISCFTIDRALKYRKEWEFKISKPRSIVISEQCILVAAKSKVVVLDSVFGVRIREIHNDIPTHPVNIVVHDNWLFTTKSSTSNSESRTIRKIRLQN